MLYVFHGSDSFSRLEALRELKQQLDQDGMLETNTTLLDARQATPQEVLAACNTPPFLGSKRLVIVEGVLQQVEGGAKAKRSKRRGAESGEAEPDVNSSPWQALLDDVDAMPETTVLVLVDGALAQSELLTALRAKGDVRRFELPDQKTVPQWIQSRARIIGLKMEARAVGLLANLVGNDTWTLAGELEKLCVYAGGGTIRELDVRELVSAAREQKGYLLADAVADGRAAVAVRLLHELRAQTAPDQLLLATIEGRYRRLAIAREMLDAGAGDRSIGARVGSSGYGLERLIEQAQRYSAASLRMAFARLVQADADIKLGVYDEELSLELLIDDLAAVSASRAA
jgi:DNA polymerase-3 subunit delta